MSGKHSISPSLQSRIQAFGGSSRDESEPKPRVAITGATGFIGIALLRALRDRHSHECAPVALVRQERDVVRLERVLDARGAAEETVVVDYNQTATLERALRGARVVVHCAAVVDGFVDTSEASNVEKANVALAKAVVEAAVAESRRARARVRFVFVSSTEAIGQTASHGPPADERAPRRPDSAYGHSKVACEDAIFAHSDHLDIVVLRPTGVYGPGESFFFRELLEMAESGWGIVAPSPCDGQAMFTHIDDVVDSILRAMRHPAAVGHVFNVCPRESISYFEILRVLNCAMGRRGPVACLSMAIGCFAMRLLGPLVYFRKRRKFLYHPTSIRRTSQWRVYSNEKIMSRLGFEPKYEMLDGLKKVAEDEVKEGRLRRRRISPVVSGLVSFASTVAFFLIRLRAAKELP